MKLLLTFIIYLCLVVSFSACQKKAVENPDPYQTGYEAGYKEGYTSRQNDDEKPQDTLPAQSPEASPNETPGYGRTNPAPLGAEQTIKDDGYTISVKINSVTRGEEAWNMVADANQFNDPPPENMEYMVVNITVTALASETDASMTVYGYSDFTAFSSTNSEYESPILVDPEPALEGDIYEGGSITGNITLSVGKEDPAPKLAFRRNFDGSGGLWFSLVEK